jgi:ComF family protein
MSDLGRKSMGQNHKTGFWPLAKELVSAFVDVLFPARCLSCGIFMAPRGSNDGNGPPIFSGSDSVIECRRLLGRFLCAECVQDVSPIESPVCPGCGFMFKSREGEDHFCSDCLESRKPFASARAVGVHDGAFRVLIHCLKYKGRIELALPLGRLLFGAYLKHWPDLKHDWIIPVPLHPRRLRMRGFNQSSLVLDEWRRLGETLRPQCELFQVKREGLMRNRWTEPQTSLNRKKRLKNIKNAFEMGNDISPVGRQILLVDDVYTTGATACECARTLLHKGAQTVDILTLARAG